MRLQRTRLARAWLLLALAMGGAAFAAPQVDVAEELERLMGRHGFTMNPDHLEATRTAMGRAEGTELLPRLNVLLEAFDYVIVQGPKGVDRVLILGAKSSNPPSLASQAPATPPGGAAGEQAATGEVVLESQRKGTSHALSLALEGDNGRRIQRVLLLDTGADFVVLPSSLIAQLGIQPGALKSQRVQTANGPTDARIGMLAAVWLGDRRVPAVETAFIDDARLGGNALLGMSVLNRFRVTIDDEHNRVVLAGK